MKKTILKYMAVLFSAFTAVMFTSCPSSFIVTSDRNGNLVYYFETIAGSATNDLIASFDNSIDKTSLENSIIFDTVEIERALLKMGLKNPSALAKKLADKKEELEITCSSSQDKFSFIKIKTDPKGIATQMEITLSPAILQKLITEQNNIIRTYADLLMAPCFTNEVMSKDEYIELVASLYGNDVAKDFTDGEISISLRNSLTKKRVNSVDIPIIDILTLSEEKTFVIDF